MRSMFYAHQDGGEWLADRGAAVSHSEETDDGPGAPKANWLTGVSLQYLLHYLISLKNWLNRYSWQRTPISVTAWALLRDSYHGGLCLRFRAQHIAVAVLHLALQAYGVEVPAEAEAEKPWWQVR